MPVRDYTDSEEDRELSAASTLLANEIQALCGGKSGQVVINALGLVIAYGLDDDIDPVPVLTDLIEMVQAVRRERAENEAAGHG